MEHYSDFYNNIFEFCGMRATWHTWPTDKMDVVDKHIPIAISLTPLKNITSTVRLNATPTECTSCAQPLNRYVKLGVDKQKVGCPFCGKQIFLSDPASATFAENRDEIFSTECVEYATQSYDSEALNPSFVFLVDTTTDEKELEAQKEAIFTYVSSLEAHTKIAVITYGSVVTIHELLPARIPRSFAFRDESSLIAGKIGSIISAARGTTGQATQNVFVPIEQCVDNLARVLDDISVDDWPREMGHRPERRTGVALSLATTILESYNRGNPGHVILLTGGICTAGVGQCADPDNTIPLRTHNQISEKEKEAKYVVPATNFYTELGIRASKSSICFDIFACGFDQYGLYEMNNLTDLTGGFMITAESFSDSLFIQNTNRYFEIIAGSTWPNSLAEQFVGHKATITLGLPSYIKIAGIIGPGSPVVVENDTKIAKRTIGKKSSAKISLPVLTRDTTITIFLEVDKDSDLAPAAFAGPNQDTTRAPIGSESFYNLPEVGADTIFQATLAYHTVDGIKVNRVLSHKFKTVRDSPIACLRCFDQDTAAVVMSRLTLHTMLEGVDSRLALKKLDRTITSIASSFGAVDPHDPKKFNFFDNFIFFPQTLFHFRRSPYFEIISFSPDETTYYTHYLMNSDVMQSLTMISPNLYSYNSQDPPVTVILDSSATKKDHILILDTFFKVVVWRGSAVASWIKAGYQNQEGFTWIKDLLDNVSNDAHALANSHFPVASLIECDAGSSAARYIMSRLNPGGNAHNKGSYDAEDVLTDDIPLQVYIQRLNDIIIDKLK